ncbi:DNA-binding response regulator [Paenibacillus baekrokdamisoli]|uniref:DNA-binding response regulator n=1 Tax=Paenibacillus baekrokdamisoli TaxID=1712516 RepID=A0A3G9J083_9BACL|nr:response regulator transcription factor [Paenibacillus baekrokdamisoli]MBB3071852.1 DNA-binding response OmpR family regulator [Paenibacillus baekrokdamisoli]BBH24166.1 DNA-binding response regulator [Paenibacillus baekrokdamisoli]
MKILLAEDDPLLGELIAHMLKKKAGYSVDWVTEGEEAYDYAAGSSYDVLILDWMMPGGDGTTICRRLRKEGYMGAVLMLTAKDTLQDRIEGLDAGADDYLVKPFEIDELLARLRALTRRNYAPIQEDTVLIRNYELHRMNQTVHKGSDRIQLSPREFQLFDLLVQNKGLVLTREIIFDRIWGLDADVNLKTIDATIKLLRKKLGSSEQDGFIQSVRGVGYKLEN